MVRDSVDNCTEILYSRSPTWHTPFTYAAPLARSARFSPSDVLEWSGEDDPSHDESVQTSPLPRGDAQSRCLAVFGAG
jgi:hypothetical protein